MYLLNTTDGGNEQGSTVAVRGLGKLKLPLPKVPPEVFKPVVVLEPDSDLLRAGTIKADRNYVVKGTALDTDTSIAGIKRRAVEVVSTYPKRKTPNTKRTKAVSSSSSNAMTDTSSESDSEQQDQESDRELFVAALVAFVGWDKKEPFHIGEVVKLKTDASELTVHYFNVPRNCSKPLGGVWTKRWTDIRDSKEISAKVGVRSRPVRSAVPMEEIIALEDVFCVVELSPKGKLTEHSQKNIKKHLEQIIWD
jgi:hypothetical protein